MTNKQINKIKESATKNVRSSMALEGVKISDVNFEKLARLAPTLWKLS